MRTCLLTMYDEAFNAVGDIAKRSFERAMPPDVVVKVYGRLFDQKYSPSWNKLYAIKAAFQQGYERVLWCDADSIYTGIPLVLPYSHPFTVSSDSNGICCSHMLINNTAYNWRLIETLLFLGDVKKDEAFGSGKKHEQNALKGLLQHFNLPVTIFQEGFVVEHGKKVQPHTAFIHYPCMWNKERAILMQASFQKYDTKSNTSDLVG